MSPHTRIERKALGAYYTPAELSKVLADWAIRTPHDLILEPSFGGCGFLEATIESLKSHRCDAPSTQIFGADIDSRAFDSLLEKFSHEIRTNNFIHKDFLNITPEDFKKTEFDVVIGNPPYVSLHNMKEGQRSSCFNIIKTSQFVQNNLGKHASLWAFFLVHSLDFIKENGRIAWVLPSSFLHADYAKEVLNIHKKHFEKIKIIRLYERFFQGIGADEISVIVTGEGFTKTGHQNATVTYHSAETSQKLKESLNSDIGFILKEDDNYKISLITKNANLIYEEISLHEHSKLINDLAKITIGMVTGDNKTFIIKEQTRTDNQILMEDTKPVVGRFSQLIGLTHDFTQHKKNVLNNERCLLLCPSDIKIRNTPIRTYLSKVSRLSRQKNKTFPKRKFWFQPDDQLYPDAFLSYMIHKGPRLVLNLDKINCTNSIHKIFFKDTITDRQKLAVTVSILSSYSQLSAELAGRSYGSGVLKLEPTPAKKIKILTSTELDKNFESNFKEINKLVQSGKIEDATILVDNIICETLNINQSHFQLLAEALTTLRAERYKGLRS